MDKAAQSQSADLESKYAKYFGSQIKPDAIKPGDKSSFDIFTMYQPVTLIYAVETAK